MKKLILIYAAAALFLSACGEPLTPHEKEMRDIERKIADIKKVLARTEKHNNKPSNKRRIKAGHDIIYTYRRDALPVEKWEELLSQSDDYEIHKERFILEAQNKYRLGFCGTKSFKDAGGFIKSGRYVNAYFVWCGDSQFMVYMDNEFKQTGIEPAL